MQLSHLFSFVHAFTPICLQNKICNKFNFEKANSRMGQKGLLNVATVAVVALAVPQIRRLSLSVFRKVFRLPQATNNALPEDSQVVLAASESISERACDTEDGASQESIDSVLSPTTVVEENTVMESDIGEAVSTTETACPSTDADSFLPVSTLSSLKEDQCSSMPCRHDGEQQETNFGQRGPIETQPSDTAGENGRGRDGRFVFGADDIVNPEGLVRRAVIEQEETIGGETQRDLQNVCRGVTPSGGAAGSNPVAPNGARERGRAALNRPRVFHAQENSASRQSYSRGNVWRGREYDSRDGRDRTSGWGFENRRNSTIPLTCARCGLVGHRASCCNRPFVPIPLHWSYPMRGLAQSLRERAGVPVEWVQLPRQNW